MSERLAVWITDRVGTMSCAYIFLAWSLLPLLVPSTEAVVAYVSQSVVQLVLLPLIMVGQGVMSRASDARAADTHRRITDLGELIEEQREELSILRELHNRSEAWDCLHNCPKSTDP